MEIYLSALIAIIGLLIYLLAGNPPNTAPYGSKVSEVGRIMFFCGLLAFLFGPGIHTLFTR